LERFANSLAVAKCVTLLFLGIEHMQQW